MTQVSLATFVARKRLIPAKARGDPWSPNGNILLISDLHAYKSHKALLTAKSTWFAYAISQMNDDSVDVIDDCVVLPLEGTTSSDLRSFLMACHGEEEGGGTYFPFENQDDFEALAGTLRLATKYNADALRANAIATLEQRYPTTITGWDRVRNSAPPIASTSRALSPFFNTPQTDPDQWKCDPVLIINLAREVGAFSILPAAMAMLTNDSSAGEVFGVSTLPILAPTPLPTRAASPSHPRVRLNSDDEAGFALLKEFNHISVLRTLKFIRAVGELCTRPPEFIPTVTGRAPVGANTLLPGASQCRTTFREISSALLESLVLENPVGYAEFVGPEGVGAVRRRREKMCKFCWREFERGTAEMKKVWWEALPRVLGFENWEDERLQPVEL
ncbi:hypothetical protein DXG03_007464 [Asterophora parasitica]|uniref:BTB domain-containing protein n=1 Tax=Asterophora parasitica TaxID=117018 RepID=A0A9P7G6G4_9AGAR|nr:hypothetical protein DXG03_007464 [Asterophora parasitica]